MQAAYSADFSKALENVVFFYAPFALLFVLLREVRWTRGCSCACLAWPWRSRSCSPGIGFIEYARRKLFLNPKLVAADQYGNYFRVNSALLRPQHLRALPRVGDGRGDGGVLWSARRRPVLAGGAVLLWLLAGLVTSFSQSSIAALLLGLAVMAA